MNRKARIFDAGFAAKEEKSPMSPMIKKIKEKYIVLSEKTGRSFGSYKTIAEAKKRLRQIEFFKHLKARKK